MLLPALNKARESAKTVACLSNLRQLGVIMLNYTTDNRGALMPTYPWKYPITTGDSTWLGLLWHMKYFKSVEVTRCPSDKVVTTGRKHGPYSFGPWDPSDALSGDGKCGYGYNHMGLGLYYGISPHDIPGVTGETVAPGFAGWKITQADNPAETYWMADNSDLAANAGAVLYMYPPDEGPLTRHNKGINVLWLDGHASWLDGPTAVNHYLYGFIFAPGTPIWYDVRP
jgi:prepilin-type processing-associated H-X9-DG protein